MRRGENAVAVTIESLEKNSPAARLGLQPGDSLVTIDGHEINDMLDYEFYTARTSFALDAVRGGELCTLPVQKE
jgi:S1-C subfamily serine protease